MCPTKVAKVHPCAIFFLPDYRCVDSCPDWKRIHEQLRCSFCGQQNPLVLGADLWCGWPEVGLVLDLPRPPWRLCYSVSWWSQWDNGLDKGPIKSTRSRDSQHLLTTGYKGRPTCERNHKIKQASSNRRGFHCLRVTFDWLRVCDCPVSSPPQVVVKAMGEAGL